MKKVLSIILGGGKGTRLYPLTKERSKPAVPFGGKHRIVDIPISNCINSGFNKIYILTQFNSASLNMHISNTYKFDNFSKGFVEILAAEQTLEHSGWYEGTADAVRKNFGHFKTQNPSHYIILSGDQLYQMDLDEFLDDHIKSGAQISIATTAVTRQEATEFGIMQVDKKLKIKAFKEKPAKEENIDDWIIPDESRTAGATKGKDYLASMGIYIFDAKVLEEVLDNEHEDFGKTIIPMAIKKYKVKSYIYDGYWEDIGTLKNFFDCTIELTTLTPRFNFYNELKPIYTNPRNLPASKVNHANISNSITSEGCIINYSTLINCVIGIRTIIAYETELENVICMGADFYETDEERENNKSAKKPDIGIGEGTRIKNTIIDKNARIGKRCIIGIGPMPPEGETPSYVVKDGIIVIKKNAIIPDNTVI